MAKKTENENAPEINPGEGKAAFEKAVQEKIAAGLRREIAEEAVRNQIAWDAEQAKAK